MAKNDFVSTIGVDYTTLLDLLQAENMDEVTKRQEIKSNTGTFILVNSRGENGALQVLSDE
ncbi:hypothetical protein JOY44_30865 (plasmid) [Phormidium sp. CLA17]|uniref:hypothetical protein n=1 Tax=Leptolyngbya sp. Cla-17 TaxID=2803751 RepID=UPI001492594F|nr:hypothetical protein [Leptolyngbya sp. Cla-17]MBM0745780.1 hypothetical protein [Leptolyngbya sp. Cla-17]